MANNATVQDYLDKLAAQEPDFWAWLQGNANALERVRDAARRAKQEGSPPRVFVETVRGMGAYTKWQESAVTPEGEVPTEEEEDRLADMEAAAEEAAREDARDLLRGFLSENELPDSLMGFIESALGQGWSYAEIVARLRETPEYLAAYPENAMREARGLSWWPEARIREYRDTAKRLVREYLGSTASNQEIAGLITGEVDLAEWERRLQSHAAFLQWGPVVKQALGLELGFEVPDERVWAFMNPDIPTPELDLAYRRALMRGQPAVLGFGIRPSEEADILIQHGFTPEAAFKGYQGVAEELPRVERMKMLESYLNQNAPTENILGEATFGQLFRALMLRDVNAFNELSQLAARSVAMWRAGGGPSGGGRGLLVESA